MTVNKLEIKVFKGWWLLLILCHVSYCFAICLLVGFDCMCKSSILLWWWVCYGNISVFCSSWKFIQWNASSFSDMSS